jgi:uncharacterized protein (UPF0297 family)
MKKPLSVCTQPWLLQTLTLANTFYKGCSMTSDNVVQFKSKAQKLTEDTEVTLAKLYEVDDDTHENTIPTLMGYMIEDDRFLLIQSREATQEDIEAGEAVDEDNLIIQSVVLTQKQLQFISSYAITFFLIEDLDEISE